MVIWLIGLSGVGKSTIGRLLHRRWQALEANTVLIDGDEIRKVFQHDRDPDAYSVAGRRRNADRVNRLCAWLDRQNVNVVCCLLSLFEDSRRWNRENLTRYFEVYLTAPMDVLEARDTKGLYAAAKAGRERNVVGYDIPFPPPAMPDLILDTNDPANAAEKAAERILALALDHSSATRGSDPAVSYDYARGSLLEEPQTYFYTPYRGRPFLDAWTANRAAALSELGQPSVPPAPEICADSSVGPFLTDHLLEALYRVYVAGRDDRDADQKLGSLVRRFEITKRIHRCYSERWRPVDAGEFRDLRLYIRFAEVLEAAYSRQGGLVLLNALLKCIDTLIALRRDLPSDLTTRLARLIRCETAHVKLIGARAAL